MEGQMTFEFAKRPTIKGYPELRWTGKRPYESTQYYPAQLRERYGEETNGWINKIFWGDNLQVMSHLLKGVVARAVAHRGHILAAGDDKMLAQMDSDGVQRVEKPPRRRNVGLRRRNCERQRECTIYT